MNGNELLQVKKNFRLNNLLKGFKLKQLLKEFDIEYYDINLECDDCILHDAKNAYIKLIKEYHPDNGGDPEVATYINNVWNTIKERLTRKPTVMPDFIKNNTNIRKNKIKPASGIRISLKNIDCPACKMNFKPRQRNQEFCSRKCKDNNKKIILKEVVCPCCNNRFLQRNYKNKYCSDYCKRKFWEKNLKDV